MNTIPLSITDALWVLDGHVDESEPMRHVAISVNPFRIGRSPELALCLQCRSISKLHAEIVLCDDGLSITDLGSKNGTFINGKQITEAEALQDGDLVQFGKVAFRVSQELTERSTNTISVDVGDRALALVQFDTLMSTRAVVPFFQPIVEVQEGQTVGYELLARSNLRGLKNPHVMFLAAARLDLEAELSRLIRSEGIRAGTTLPTAPHLFLNVHPVELTKPGLVRSLREIRDGGSTQSLTVEIHEAAVTNPTKMQHLRDRLRELDVKLAYDDFGAGQARLIELVKVPPDYLKFDISLIRDIAAAGAHHQHLVETLVQFAKELGIAPVAEGIETLEDSETCRRLGFELGQGYYYGRPATAASYAATS